MELSPEEGKQFASLVALMARRGFGEEGPPRETTFAEIEQFGHQAGRMMARAIDAHLAVQHAAHFTDEPSCPTCSEKHPPKESPHELPLQTPDGEVTLHEPTCRCSTCHRDFFPQRLVFRIDGRCGLTAARRVQPCWRRSCSLRRMRP